MARRRGKVYLPHSSIKNRRQYDALKRKGFSKSEAAAISNASWNKGHYKSGRRRRKR